MKLIVLTSSRFGTASNCLPILSGSAKYSIARVIVSRGLQTDRARLWQRKLKKTMRIGVLGALNGIRMRTWYDGGHPTADLVELCQRLGIPVFETENTNSEETVRLFREAAPDLGLSLGNGYISHRVFSIPKYGMINAHGERLPAYQNAQSVIWPIYHLETQTGLTIHQIDRSIDTGKILYREEYPIVFCAKLENTVRRTLEITQERTPPAVRYVCENYELLMNQATAQENGRSFTTPSIWQFLRMVRNNRILYTQK
ncbi:MAG: formyltransferase family protein [Planctomycetota bacterium]|nr:formyltransferase family protein [Planctomycetota bacterium]